MDLKGRSLATLRDFTREEILFILNTAVDMKARFKNGEKIEPMKDKMMAMIFQKPSLRTRVSFQTGMYQLGGSAMYLGPSDIGLGKRETTEDIAKVLGRQVDVIMARVFGHEIIDELVKHAGVPVINGLSAFTHPCQALADLQTVMEHGKKFEDSKLAFIGDGNNVANSLVFGGVRLGMHIAVASPEGCQITDEVRTWADENGAKSGGKLSVTSDPREAVKDADAVYTDVWASMGQEQEAAEKKKRFEGFRVDDALVKLAKPDAIVLHCLPAHYDEEIAHEVAHGPHSAIWDEAENRLHAQKALIALIAG